MTPADFLNGILEYPDQSSQLVKNGNYVEELFGLWSTLTGLGHFKSYWSARDDRISYERGYRSAFEHATDVANGASAFSTKGGLVGCAPSSVRLGDSIVQVRSFRPFIAVRKSDDLHTFQGQVFRHSLWGSVFQDTLS